ncbi:DUF507 family protein [Candidatus Nitrosotenuis cloacae]|uniref:DUF507 family protein n=1 Tax=Candidatus Nitrosotenuis cloacae TaxID=1603555 RepID=UPI00227E359A|nr:DUF507 family protein [Candidatus Nitrosotenuis cloacae]
MAELTKPVPIKVMLGDTTVTDQTTFDPGAVSAMYSKILDRLPGWQSSGVSTTTDEDLRRIFVKLEKQVGNYIILWHISLQYHALLYYRPDIRVQKIQTELAEILDNTVNKEKELANLTDSIIREKLEALGYKDVDDQKLFEILFNQDGFRDQLSEEMSKKTDYDFKAKEDRKKELFNQIDNLLLETYQTTSVLIDENRLITGEEGCLCTLDMDFLKKNAKQAAFDPRRISKETRQEVECALDEIVAALSS